MTRKKGREKEEDGGRGDGWREEREEGRERGRKKEGII